MLNKYPSIKPKICFRIRCFIKNYIFYFVNNDHLQYCSQYFPTFKIIMKLIINKQFMKIHIFFLLSNY